MFGWFKRRPKYVAQTTIEWRGLEIDKSTIVGIIVHRGKNNAVVHMAGEYEGTVFGEGMRDFMESKVTIH